MANKEMTTEKKLRALYDLQIIDSKIDEIKRIRGSLPIEIQHINDKIEGKGARVSKLEEDIQHNEKGIIDKKNTIKEAEEFIKKYKEQHKNVRNNREYNSIAKEIEYQNLEIELCEKKIKEFQAQLEIKKEAIEEENVEKKYLQGFLKEKEQELKVILLKTEKQEKILSEKALEFRALIEERLLRAYGRLRKNLKNGLAVVSIKRGASAGSFFTIPPQQQLEVAARKKIITDEHSGRILVDPALAEEEEEKITGFLK